MSAWSVLSAPLVCNTCAQQREVFPKWCGVPGQWQGHHSARTPAASQPCDEGGGDSSGAAAGCCLASHSPELCEQSRLVPQFRAQHPVTLLKVTEMWWRCHAMGVAEPSGTEGCCSTSAMQRIPLLGKVG